MPEEAALGNFVTGTRETGAAIETVWGLLIDVEAWPETFTPHLREAHLDGGVEVGAEGWVQTKLPLPRSSFTVTSVEPGRRWSWRGQVLWLTMDFDHRCEPTDNGTRVTFDVDLTGPMSSAIRPVARLTYRPQMERALDLLVEHAERS